MHPPPKKRNPGPLYQSGNRGDQTKLAKGNLARHSVRDNLFAPARGNA
jgi:hypothetical protein